MTEQEWQINLQVDAFKLYVYGDPVGSMRHDAFKDGVEWCRNNPPPEVMKFIEVIRAIIGKYEDAEIRNPEASILNRGCSLGTYNVLINALAEFEKTQRVSE